MKTHFVVKECGDISERGYPLSVYGPNPEAASSVDERIRQGAAELLERLRRTDDPTVPYKPVVWSVRSRTSGYVHRYRSTISGRLMHLLSNGEFSLCHILDMAGCFRNVREGFGLPLLLTEALAGKEGIRHPFNRFGGKKDEKGKFPGENAPMSVDFICSLPNGTWKAVDYKPAARLGSKRVQQKLRLAKLALAEAGVEHVVMTEEHLPAQLVTNLKLLHSFASHIDQPPLGLADMTKARDVLRAALASNKRMTIFQAAVASQHHFGCPVYRLVQAALWLIARNHWNVDLLQPVHAEMPLTFKLERAS